MPKKVFNELEKEKQDRIIEAAIKEFAEYGYENGSTNRIVKECGISKGSLFKYFENKEDIVELPILEDSKESYSWYDNDCNILACSSSILL